MVTFQWNRRDITGIRTNKDQHKHEQIVNYYNIIWVLPRKRILLIQGRHDWVHVGLTIIQADYIHVALAHVVCKWHPPIKASL